VKKGIAENVFKVIGQRWKS